MTLPLPFQVKDSDVQANFDEIAKLLPPFGVRISWGLIKGSDASILAGSGDYSASRASAGVYTITWTKAKKGTAYVVALSTDSGASTLLVCDYFSKAAASFRAQMLTATAGANADPVDWSFIVIDAQ